MSVYSNVDEFFPGFRNIDTFRELLQRIPGSSDASNPFEAMPKIRAPGLAIWLDQLVGYCPEQESWHHENHLFHIHELDERTQRIVSYLSSSDIESCITFCEDVVARNHELLQSTASYQPKLVLRRLPSGYEYPDGSVGPSVLSGIDYPFRTDVEG